MSIELSVIIATYKRPTLLDRCLRALINQSVDYNLYEIIVVSDGSDKQTVESVNKVKQEYSSRPAIHCFALDTKRGPAAARNLGWQRAKGKLILFTDDDCIPLFYWLQFYENAYMQSRKEEVAFAGKVKVPLPANPTDFEKNTALLERGDFVTANCACTKKALERIGGLDEDFTMAWREDSALQFDLLENGIPVIRVDEAVVVHPVRTAPWGVSIKEQKKSMFNPLLYKKHPRLYKQKIRNWPSLHYYGIILLFIITLINAVSHNTVVTYLSLFGCAGLVIWLVTKRLNGASLAVKHVLEMIFTSLLIPFLSVFWTLYGAIRYKTFFI
jgi:glycosyltransferase involved in cell wall biosynthesis